MKTLSVTPNAGLNRRLPEHKLAGEKKQFVQRLENMLNLDGKTHIFKGASRYDSSAKPGTCTWAKRLNYEDGGDLKRFLFAVIGGKIYKGDDSLGSLNQVTISNSLDPSLESDIYPIDAALKLSGTVVRIMVDGKYFYKFSGNESGNWERLPIKLDIDGNIIEPVYICEYLDRLWVLVKNKNIILVSKNLNPEIFNHPTDSCLIEVPPGQGGFPKALAVHPNGYLYVIHEDYFGPISGSSPATFGVRPGDIIHGHGTRAPRSVAVLKETIGFLDSKDNEYHLMNDIDTPLSYPVNLGELINPVKAHETVVHIDTILNALRIAYYPSGGTTLGDEEIYSLTEDKWCGQTRDRNVSCYAQWSGNGDDRRMTTGRSDIGVVMVEDNSINFDDSPIPVFWESASYVADDEISDVTFEDLFIDGKPTGDWTLPLRYYLDSRITTGGQASLNMQGEGFGTFPIAIADQKAFINRELFLIDYCKGRMIRFDFRFSATNRIFEFYGIYARYNADNAKQTKHLVGR